MMPPAPSQEPQLTRLLRAATAGDQAAADAALPHVYGLLQQLARSRLARERAGHTLQPTALVHEAWLRLTRGAAPPWADRAAFVTAAANAMRRILIDHARRRSRLKRHHATSDDPEAVARLVAPQPQTADPDTLLRLDAAITALDLEDPRAGAVVRLRFYGGLEMPEIARVLATSLRTIERDWVFGRARLFAALQEPRSE